MYLLERYNKLPLATFTYTASSAVLKGCLFATFRSISCSARRFDERLAHQGLAVGCDTGRIKPYCLSEEPKKRKEGRKEERDLSFDNGSMESYLGKWERRRKKKVSDGYCCLLLAERGGRSHSLWRIVVGNVMMGGHLEGGGGGLSAQIMEASLSS